MHCIFKKKDEKNIGMDISVAASESPIDLFVSVPRRLLYDLFSPWLFLSLYVFTFISCTLHKCGMIDPEKIMQSQLYKGILTSSVISIIFWFSIDYDANQVAGLLYEPGDGKPQRKCFGCPTFSLS